MKKKEMEQLEFAHELICNMDPKKMDIVEIIVRAMQILDFGGLTPRQYLDFIESM
jgi:hypothetical protein